MLSDLERSGRIVSLPKNFERSEKFLGKIFEKKMRF
jgi:hypothetical protein